MTPNSKITLTNKCGTYTGWHAHNKSKERPCDLCRKARNEYLAIWREKNKNRLKEKQARYYLDNKKHLREQGRNYYQAHKQESYNQNKAWRKANPEKMAEYRKKWIEANPEKNRETKAAWSKRNPESKRLIEHRRRARMYAVENEKYTEAQVLEAYGTDCHICSKPIDLEAPRRTNQAGWENGLHLDHLVSIAKGGSNTLENIRPAHGLCNTKKGAREHQFN